MAKFIISYDLRKKGQDYYALYDAIEAMDSYCHVLESVWIVEFSGSAQDILNKLITVTDNNDSLIVLELGTQVAWRKLPNGVVKWIQSQSDSGFNVRY
jgi:hypothetical protein